MIDIVKFVEEYFGIELLEYQKILLRGAHRKYSDANLDLPTINVAEILTNDDRKEDNNG